MFEFFKIFDRLRSQIVHGSDKIKLPKKGNGETCSFLQVCAEVEGYLRRAILKMVELSRGKSDSKYLVDWEGIVFSGNDSDF